MAYLPRIVDSELDELMESLAAISIEGPRGVGKTATASRRASSVVRLDDNAVRSTVAADRTIVDLGRGTVLLDEWQRHPPIWDHVRRRVDEHVDPGRYLLTGSAVPTDAPAHSGAGRIVSLRMRPLSLMERQLVEPTVSLAALLSGTRPPVSGSSPLVLADYVQEIVASGFPAIRVLDPRARRAQFDGYLARIVERDFPELGTAVRRPATLRAWLNAYAAATATTASYNVILDAATPGEDDKPAKTTAIAYRDMLSRLWLLDPVPGWLPSRSALTRLTQSPKHHLADPGLAAHLLGAGADALLAARELGPAVPRDGTLLGHLFESLVTLSVRSYAQANECRVHHLRTKDNRREVDLIVEGWDHRIVALEVKLGGAIDDRAVQHLLWLRERLGEDLLDAAVITTGEFAYRRPDGIAVIPAALLAP